MNATPSIPSSSVNESRTDLEAKLLQRMARLRSKGPKVTLDPTTVSPAQESLWFFDQLKPGSPLYNIAQAFRLSGPVSYERMQESFRSIVARHDELRVNFRSENGKPMRVPREAGRFLLEQVDLSTEINGAAKAMRLVEESAQRPFNLADDSLLRATLFKVSPSEHYLLIVLHHIVGDFSSLVVLYRELAQHYAGFSSGQVSPSPLSVQFLDWVAGEKARVSEESWQRKTKYWKESLSGELPETELPSDRPRPAKQSYNGARYDFRFSEKLLSSLRQLSQAEGTTLYLTLLAGFEVLLARYTGLTDLVIGSPIDTRNTSDAERLIGYFVNTLPLRVKFDRTSTFREVLRHVHKAAMELFLHREVPFEKVVELTQCTRSNDRHPLYQIVFQYLPSLPILNLPGIKSQPIAVHTGTAKFDLTFTMAECGGELVGEIEYNTDLFNSSTIERFTTHFQTVLEAVTTAPEQQVSLINFLTRGEREQLMVEWNNTSTKYPGAACVHELFE
jgi:hypothetical protein